MTKLLKKFFAAGMFSLVLICLGACALSEDSEQLDPDFDVEFDQGLEQGVDETEYYNELEKSTNSISFDNSFPVAFYAGKRFTPFDHLPKESGVPSASSLTINFGKVCRIHIETGPILAVRFLYTGDWIKFEELNANTQIKLQSRMDLNLQMWSQLVVKIPPQWQKGCWKLFYGRKIYLGKLHMHRSSAGIIASPNSPQLKFARLLESGQEKTYLHWNKNSQMPVLKNDMDFPPVVKSSFYRTFMAKKGFYYLQFRPLLEVGKSRKRFFKIPTSSSIQKSTSK